MSLRIETADLWRISMRLKGSFETSFGVELDREAIVIRLLADTLEGWGECVAGAYPGYSYETARTAWHVLGDFLLPAVLGASLSGAAELPSRVQRIRGHPLAKAGLEMALWDLFGQSQGKPLSQLLGGVRDRVEVGVSVGIQRDAPALLGAVHAYLDQGYRRIKIKIRPGADLDRVQALREAFPILPLQVDANSAYELKDVGIFEAMDDLNLLLIEQPLAEDDILDHVRLQALLKTRLCLDETILTGRHALQAIEAKACGVINIKAARVGGFTEAVHIHDLCRARGVPVWCGGMLETGIGRAANLALASLPGFVLPGDISASERYYAEDLAYPLFTLNSDSTIDVPSAPGLGIEVDPRSVERFSLRHEKFSAGANPRSTRRRRRRLPS